jgi:osmoprotectant transport system substrate-binding protein
VHKRTLRLLGGLAASALLITACGDGLEGDGDDGATGETVEAGDASLDGATITVGSKDFDEQLVLGEISVALLEDAGVEVVNEVNLGGTDAARAALVNGDIDHYWEYTGTAWISFFGETEPIADRVEQYEAVRERDAEERGLYWLEPTPFNNTYGLAVSQEADAELGVDAISELGPLLESDPDLVTLCVESEFNVRDDGLPGMEAHYGFDIPDDNVTVLDTGVIYGATADRDPCNLGEVFTTDGRIAALDLKVLEDDEAFFPLYNVSPVFVEDVYAEYGQTLADLYAPVAAALDDDTMAALNARVSADGERPSDVAVDWLTENGFIG